MNSNNNNSYEDPFMFLKSNDYNTLPISQHYSYNKHISIEDGNIGRKRNRASSKQLEVLEASFNKNANPNTKTREQLARQLNMTDRSVQIWFQNRRAKVKLIKKRNYMLQEEAIKHQISYTDGYQATRLTDSTSINKNLMGYLSSNFLSVGGWVRTNTNEDLETYYNLATRVLGWKIKYNTEEFKMEIQFSSISSIHFINEKNQFNEEIGKIIIDTNQIPNFFFKSGNEWAPCQDFTMNKQATKFFKYCIYGDSLKFQNELFLLAQKDVNICNLTNVHDLNPNQRTTYSNFNSEFNFTSINNL